MDTVYHWIGFAVVWLSAIAGCLALILFFYVLLVNWIGRKFKSLYIIVEYQFYKERFKEWIKDKERHPKMQ